MHLLVGYLLQYGTFSYIPSVYQSSVLLLLCLCVVYLVFIVYTVTLCMMNSIIPGIYEVCVCARSSLFPPIDVQHTNSLSAILHPCTIVISTRAIEVSHAACKDEFR